MPVMTADDLHGQHVVGSDGAKVGKVAGVYTDEATGKPEWAAVSTGLFGTKEALIPLSAAQETEQGLTVPFDKAMVRSAPHHNPGHELSQAEEAELFQYYGIPYGGETVTATNGAPSPNAGRDTSGPTTDSAMTRSEEQLQVGTQTVETGRVRLRKHVVTEQVSQTVPVSHEEIRVEREPITEANVGQALDGPEISEEEHEIVLHAERPVVAKTTVPVERVRLATDTVTEDAQIEETVRKEQIETRR